MHFRIGKEYLAVAFLRNDRKRLVVRLHKLSDILQTLSNQCAELAQEVEVCDPVNEIETAPVSVGFHDYTLSGEILGKNFSHISSLSFHTTALAPHIPGSAYVFCFPLTAAITGFQSNIYLTTHRFSTPASVGIDIICIGDTGIRAVWLQRHWDTDKYTLMKGTFSPDPEEPPIVANLLPPHLALPFETYTCQSLAFDESTSRVCLGLHTGDLYILELYVQLLA